MDEEITALEDKLTELVNAVSSLRQENNEMNFRDELLVKAMVGEEGFGSYFDLPHAQGEFAEGPFTIKDAARCT